MVVDNFGIFCLFFKQDNKTKMTKKKKTQNIYNTKLGFKNIKQKKMIPVKKFIGNKKSKLDDIDR